MTHFLGGKDQVIRDVNISVNGRLLGVQKMQLVEPGIAFRVSAIGQKKRAKLEKHLRKLLHHAALDAIQWIDITRENVTFTTLERDRQ